MRVQGLSPRGRGNPQYRLVLCVGNGSIPAWAGEPFRAALNLNVDSVYPRVGGGTALKDEALGLMTGLSPRGRGNLLSVLLPSYMWGSIPAWAGEPDPEVRRARLVRRYYTRQGHLQGDCFYAGLCEPIEETERRIRETSDYIDAAERLADRHDQ